MANRRRNGRGLLVALAVCSGLWACRSPRSEAAKPDWLLDPGPYRAEIQPVPDSGLVLKNGLLRRELRLSPDAATVDFTNLVSGEALLRAVRPEARVVIDGRAYNVGGLTGQPEQGYLLPEWLAGMTADPAAFRFRSYEIGRIVERFAWKKTRYAANTVWPPPGAAVTLMFDPPPDGPAGVVMAVRYEIYDGLPLISKSLLLRNGGSQAVRLDSFDAEILAAVESESSVNTPPGWAPPAMHVESDMAYLADSPALAARTTLWLPDPAYTSQVNYRLETPCLLVSRPLLGPGVVIEPGGSFESFRTYELLFDSSDRERRGLALRRMYRTLAPWVTENPILMHLKSTDPEVVRTGVDQAADAGFEMVILSFGSGLDMENERPEYLRVFKELADYAHARGVEIGGYSLLASRRISDEVDVVDPKTGRPGGAAFGHSPCLGSAWGREYFRKIRNFFETTGFDLLEHDGSYPGDVCASTRHPGHRGLADSQWAQWRAITEFYRWCRGRGVSLNVPDWYFLAGSNKSAMGYREVNWSLPRDRQVILGRQNIYDGTWTKTPSMGWMFVPLVEYQGGGAAATLEPLAEHLEHYEAHLAQNFASGVQACYRGTRLYDTERTRAVVKRWVDFYKKYRAILDSDIIHVRRPDGRDLDAIVHVNPRLAVKGLAVVWNPTDREIAKDLTLPLYYTGLVTKAAVSEREGPPLAMTLDPERRLTISVRVPARGLTWFTFEAAK